MMQEGALSYDSPLYGRRTGQWKLNSLKFQQASKFLPEYSFNSQIEAYSVLGGIPAYLQQFDPEKDLMSNIESQILSKGSYLYEEPEFILRQSLRKPSRYMKILEEMSHGATKTSEIASKVGVETSNLSPYLNKLQELELVKKETPVTAGEKSRGLYKVADNFFKFYYRFIYPNKTELESHRTNEVKKTVEQGLKKYSSETFEEICRETVRKTGDYSQVGKWWYREKEIDVAAINPGENRLLLGEAKWTTERAGTDLLRKLENKKHEVRWQNQETRTEKLALFSKNGFTQDLKQKSQNRKDLKLYNLQKIQQILKN